MTDPQKIAYTVGEPAGIGPELILQLAQSNAVDDVVVIGDRRLLEKRAQQKEKIRNLFDATLKQKDTRILQPDFKPNNNW